MVQVLRKSGDRAPARQRDLVAQRPVEAMDPHVGVRVLQVVGDEMSTDEAGPRQPLRLLRDHLAPCIGCWRGQRDGHDAPSRRLPCCLEVERLALVAQEIVQTVPGVEQPHHRRVLEGPLLHVDGVRRVAVEDRVDEPSTVVGDLGRGIAAWVVGDLEHQRVVLLRGAEAMVMDADLLLVVAAAIGLSRVA